MQWESKNLIAMSTAIEDWLTSSKLTLQELSLLTSKDIHFYDPHCFSGLASNLMKQGAMMTVLSSLLVALAWPATLLAATDYIDSKWTIAIDRFKNNFPVNIEPSHFLRTFIILQIR